MASGSIERDKMIGVSATKSFSLAAGQSTIVTADFSDVIPDGYMMMAVNTITFSGTYPEYLALNQFSVSNANKQVSVRVRSLASSSTITANMVVWVVCSKNYVFS